MNWFCKNLGLLPALAEAIIHKPDTVAYPFSPAEISEHFRGSVQINAENCTGCGLCVRDCPAMALDLFRQDRHSFQLIHYPARCTFCGQCEEICRNQAIYLTNQFVDATTDPDQLTKILKDSTQPDNQSE